MSVFRLKEWWDVQVGSQGEDFDTGCLVIGNIDNSRNFPSDKIVVGSLQGMLRIYNPSHPTYRVEDLVLEEQLSDPILQLLIGRFIPSANYLALAVLHPTKLVVYEVVGDGGRDASKGSAFFTLQKCYAHDLGIDGKHFSAYNMAAGLFGGILDREMIIVQSMDGKLQIFEQTAVALIRQFVDCLVPGPISYLPRIDAFVTVNHATLAICYRYQVIASAQTDLGSKGKGERDRDTVQESKNDVTGAFGLTAVRSAMVEWESILGEHCRQVLDGCFSTKGGQSSGQRIAEARREPEGEILFICERSMILIKDSGVVLQQRLLDRSPACACSFRPNNSPFHHLILANHDGTLQIYAQMKLAWAAKLDRPAVHISVGDFGSQKGLIVILDDMGRLRVSYLGTRPPVETATTVGVRELDYNKVEEDHRALLHVIRDSQSERKSEPKEKLLIRSQVSQSYDLSPIDSDLQLPPFLAQILYTQGTRDSRDSLARISVRVFLSYSGSSSISDVSLSIRCPGFAYVSPHSILLKSISGARSTPTIVKLTFFASTQFLPVGLEAEIAASFIAASGEPQMTSHRFLLPLCLATCLRGATKSAQYKLTIDTDHPACSLLDLFSDMVLSTGEAGGNVDGILGATASQAMGFQLWSGGIEPNSPPASVSILVSKSAGRYRVQSDHLSALYVITSELERRLSLQLNKTAPASASHVLPIAQCITCNDHFPFAEYFKAIESHFNTRMALVNIYSQLNDRAHFFRAIQKKLLTRFKDKNPLPLSGADLLMRDSYSQLLLLSDEAETAQSRLMKQSFEISSLSRLLVQMTALRLALPAHVRGLLEAYLCVFYQESSGGNEENSGTGWEEMVDSAMVYLLKTVLAKQQKDVATMSSVVEMPPDVEGLKRHIAVVFDRLERGASLMGEGSEGKVSDEERIGDDDNSRSYK